MNNINDAFGYALSNVNPIAKTNGLDLDKITKLLKHKHLLETIERIDYEGLPEGLDKDLIERILFYRFKGAYFEFNDKPYFLPFTLKGDIDSYGRYEIITPVLFTGQWSSNAKNKESMFLPSTVSESEFVVCYHKEMELKPNQIPAIILTDTSLEVSQDMIPMNEMIDPLIEQLREILVLVNIDLITSAKAFYIVAKDQNQKEAIEQEFKGLDRQILNGKRVVVLTSELQLQELSGTQGKDQARYFQTYQSFDNLRKDIIGVENGGTFMKQEHQTDAETSQNSNGSSYVLKNVIRMREEWADLVNHYYGKQIKVNSAEMQEDSVVADEGEQTKQLRGDDE